MECLSQPKQEVDRIIGLDVLALNVEVGADAIPSRRERDGADHAQSVALVPRTLLRPAATRCPSPSVLSHCPNPIGSLGRAVNLINVSSREKMLHS